MNNQKINFIKNALEVLRETRSIVDTFFNPFIFITKNGGNYIAQKNEENKKSDEEQFFEMIKKAKVFLFLDQFEIEQALTKSDQEKERVYRLLIENFPEEKLPEYILNSGSLYEIWYNIETNMKNMFLILPSRFDIDFLRLQNQNYSELLQKIKNSVPKPSDIDLEQHIEYFNPTTLEFVQSGYSEYDKKTTSITTGLTFYHGKFFTKRLIDLLSMPKKEIPKTINIYTGEEEKKDHSKTEKFLKTLETLIQKNNNDSKILIEFGFKKQ